MTVTLSNSRNAPGVDAQAKMTLRMTTSIVSFDAAAGVVETASGRRYMLSGPPVSDAEILAAMAAYALLNAVVLDADVTAEFWSGAGGCIDMDKRIAKLRARNRKSGSGQR